MTIRISLVLSLTLLVPATERAWPQEAIPCLPQEYFANHQHCPAHKPSKQPEQSSPFLDVDKLRARGPFYAAPPNPKALLESSNAVLGGCVVAGTFEELTRQHGPGRNRICMAGFTQILPKTTYNVLGISSATPLDSLKSLRCYTSDDDVSRMSFSGPASLGSLSIKCVGSMNGTAVTYRPLLIISKAEKKLIVAAAKISVCGPDVLVDGGETYRALIGKYGKPVAVNRTFESESHLASVRFSSGSTVLTVRIAEAEHSPLAEMGCNSVLQFDVDESQYGNDFVQQLNAAADSQEAGVKAKF